MILLPMVLRQIPSTWQRRQSSSEIEQRNLLLKISSLLKEMMKNPLKKVNLRKLAVLRTTPTALQRAAIGKPKTKAKVVFSNTFVLGANLTVM